MRVMRMRRTITVTTASVGTATTSPMPPSKLPITSTDMIVSTGGRSTLREMTSGETTFPSMRWTTTPRPTTSNECPNGSSEPKPVPFKTKSAGSVVETSVPKNGMIAANPLNTPNGNQNGTRSA